MKGKDPHSNLEQINILTHPFLNVYRIITIIVLVLSGLSFIFTGLLAEYTKETIDKFDEDFGIGIGITDIISNFI